MICRDNDDNDLSFLYSMVFTSATAAATQVILFEILVLNKVHLKIVV